MGFSIRGVGVPVVPVVLVLLVATARAVHAAPAAPGVSGVPAASDALKLSDVITVAVRQSPELERARIDVAAAQAQLLEAEGSEDTHLGARADASAIRAASTDPNGDLDQEHVEVSASRTFSTGGTLRVVAGGDLTHLSTPVQFVNGVPVTRDVLKRYSSSLELGVTQPLLRGGGSAAFEAPIRQAARRRDAAALTREARARDLVVSLAQAYWQVAFAWRQLEVRKASLELAQQQLDYTERAIRTEKLPPAEALAVRQAIAVRKQDVLAGEQDLYERSLALRQLGGLEIGPDAIALRTEALPAAVEAGGLDVEAAVRQAFEHSAELASLEASRHAAEIALAAADNAARSRLDLGVTAGVLGAARTAQKALSSTVNDPGFQVTASLTFDHAIEGRGERGGQAAARAAELAAKVAERDARAKLAVRTTRAVQRANAALASLALGDEAISLAEQNIVAEQKRFELGKSTNFEVLRRQDELEQARLRHASAVADYLTARVELDGLSGAILARFGIVMP